MYCPNLCGLISLTQKKVHSQRTMGQEHTKQCQFGLNYMKANWTYPLWFQQIKSPTHCPWVGHFLSIGAYLDYPYTWLQARGIDLWPLMCSLLLTPPSQLAHVDLRYMPAVRKEVGLLWGRAAIVQHIPCHLVNLRNDISRTQGHPYSIVLFTKVGDSFSCTVKKLGNKYKQIYTVKLYNHAYPRFVMKFLVCVAWRIM